MDTSRDVTLRETMSDAFFYLAYVVGLAAAVGWGYFIGRVEWGTSLPGWGLWWMTFSIGSAIAFLVGLSAMVAVHARLFPEDDQLDGF